MRFRKWTLRVAVVLAVGLPWLLLLVPKPKGLVGSTPIDGRELDLTRVYARLTYEPDFRTLRDWCGLLVTSAAGAELDTLYEALRLPADDWIILRKGAWRESMMAAVKHRPDQFQWFRVHHPTDPNQWLGIGVMELYSTGGPPIQAIYVRVPVGIQWPA